MKEPINKKNKLITEFGWYILGTFIPIFISFIKNPIFTRHFSAEEFGYYSLVFLTYNYVALVLLSWLTSNVWRYYYQYKEEGKCKELFSNIGIIYLAGSLILLIFTLVWLNFTELILVKRIIVFSFLYYLFNDITSIYLVVIRLEKSVIEYNALQIIRAAINFLFLCVLAFTFQIRIEAMAIGFFVSTILVVGYIAYKSIKQYDFLIPSIGSVNKSIAIHLRYGLMSMITGFAMLVLNSSDRYLIAMFNPINIVGIYNQNYLIAQTSVFALCTVFFNTINPDLNKKLTSDISTAGEYIAKVFYIYTLLLGPVVFYTWMFSSEINTILLGKDFRDGYPVIAFVSLGFFVNGYSLISTTKLKFANNFKPIYIGYAIACVLNILLNYFILQEYSFIWASITTLISFGLLSLYFAWKDKLNSILFVKKYYKQLLFIFSILALQFLADYLLWNFTYLKMNIFNRLAEAIILVLVLLLLIYANRKKLSVSLKV